MSAPTRKRKHPRAPTPKQVASFLADVLGYFWPRQLRCEEEAAVFTTVQFAGRFDLTIEDAHAILNGFAQDDLLAFAGLKEGVEAWACTQDGCEVFDSSVTRSSVRELQATKALLTEMSVALQAQGVTEISVGGRAAFGQPNGRLLIGLRLSHPVGATVKEVELFRKVALSVGRVLPMLRFTIYLFHALPPYRLAKRLALTGGSAGEVLLASKFSGGEAEEIRASLLKRSAHGLFLDGQEVALTYPMRGKCSSVRMVCPVAAFLEAHAEEDRYTAWSERGWNYDHEVKSAAVLAEYALATGGPEGLVPQKPVDPDGPWALICRAHSAFKRMPAAEVQVQVRHGIRWRWLDVQRADEIHTARTARPTQNTQARHYVAFDFLNFDEGRLAGFVRCTQGVADVDVRRFREAWDFVLESKLRLPTAHAFGKSGRSWADLSLWLRPATPEEETCLQQLAADVGLTFKYVMIDDVGQVFAGKNQFSVYGTVFAPQHPIASLPHTLRSATWTGAVRPRYVATTKTTYGLNGAWLQATASTAERAKLHQYVVDAASVSMAAFAAAVSLPSNEALTPALTQEFWGDWQFSTQDVGWSAKLVRPTWGLELAGSGKVLSLRAWGADGVSKTYRLAPYKSKFGKPYDGSLNGLLDFLRETGRVTGLDPANEAEVSWFAFRVLGQNRQDVGWPYSSDAAVIAEPVVN